MYTPFCDRHAREVMTIIGRCHVGISRPAKSPGKWKEALADSSDADQGYTEENSSNCWDYSHLTVSDAQFVGTSSGRKMSG